ncbi:MAG: hypothetical protein M3024_01070 [Candidatus Dormibacteraeota bacterium]|nr:hypothetical protein [Candidatus Dormibacteraeota bacterium]
MLSAMAAFASGAFQPAPSHSTVENAHGLAIISLSWLTAGVSAPLAWSEVRDGRTRLAMGVLSTATFLAWATYFLYPSASPFRLVGVIVATVVATLMAFGIRDEWRDGDRPARPERDRTV